MQTLTWVGASLEDNLPKLKIVSLDFIFLGSCLLSPWFGYIKPAFRRNRLNVQPAFSGGNNF